MSGSKFSAEVPKGDGWGVDAAIAEIVRKIMAGAKSDLIPVVGVIDVKEVKIDPETHNLIAVVRVRRLEALTTLETIRNAQRMLMNQWAERRGEGAILPFEEKEMIEKAFGGVDVAQLEQDEAEARKDEGLSELDRLREHLIVVHGQSRVEVDEMDDIDTRKLHHEMHETLAANTDVADHAEDWWAWRRVDLEEETSEDGAEPTGDVDIDGPDGPGPEDEAEDSDAGEAGPDVVVPDDPSSLFQAPADPDDDNRA